MTKEDFKEFIRLSKQFQDHIRAVETRADSFRSMFFEELKEKRVFEKRIAELESKIKDFEQAQNQLLSLIYNTAVGNVTMGYTVDIESLASQAYEITGINAEQVKTKQLKVK